VCSTCNGLGWSPCLECLDTPGEVKRNCSECDHGHVCICHNCLGQGWPAGKIPCKRCAGEQRL
jgi:hypothetical protein